MDAGGGGGGGGLYKYVQGERMKATHVLYMFALNRGEPVRIINIYFPKFICTSHHQPHT